MTPDSCSHGDRRDYAARRRRRLPRYAVAAVATWAGGSAVRRGAASGSRGRAVRRSAPGGRRTVVQADDDPRRDSPRRHHRRRGTRHGDLRVVQDVVPRCDPGRADRLGKTMRAERTGPVRHAHPMGQSGRGAIGQHPQHLRTESRKQRGHGCHPGEQRRRQFPALALAADIAVLYVPADPLA